MVDRVQPLKIEGADTGGDETDLYPTAVDHNEDYLDCHGIAYQSTTSDDSEVYSSRDASDNMIFRDAANTTPVTLTDLVAGAGGLTPDAHKTLRQLIHFIDDGPAEGFTTGAYKETLPSGSIFPTSEIWYTSSGKTAMIVGLWTTWTGPKITQERWKIYDTDGSTVLWTITDAIYYTGIIETNRTRTIVSGDV